MVIGIPKEIKKHENRVALLPSGAEALIKQGHTVLIESNAGLASNFTNQDYAQYGATIISNPQEIYAKADLIAKVKEPQEQEIPLIRSNQILFTFLHLASSLDLTNALIRTNCIAIGYETIQLANGSLPLLTPMSEVAGRMSIQIGANYLQENNNGRGVLLGGVPGVTPATVLIIGAGVVGTQAALMASGLNAKIYLLDTNLERLQHLSEILPKNIMTLISNPLNIRSLAKEADLIISGVLIPGAKTPKLITRDILRSMRPRSVVVDVAIDQGGSLETSHPTSHDNAVYLEENIIHYCVTNIPAAVPVTSTPALNNASFPFLELIAKLGLERALQSSPALAKGVNIFRGQITHAAVGGSFKLPFIPISSLI